MYSIGMKLHFELQNPEGERLPFTYELHKGPTAQKFAEVTAEVLKFENNYPHGFSFGYRPSLADLELRVERMNELIHLINREARVEIPGELVPASALSQERLNFLHLKFHEYMEQLEDKNEVGVTTSALKELNILIHQIEQNKMALDSPVFTQYLIFLLRLTKDRQMSTEDHLAKTLELHFGDLMLGYCTIGKSLFHCYKDQDLELIKSQMVRDQTIIRSEVVCAFPQKDDGAEKALREREKFYEWCAENEAERYGYHFREPLHRPGNVPLGRLLQSYSYDEINDIFRHYQAMPIFELR